MNTMKFERYSIGDIFWTLQEHTQFPIFEEDLCTTIGWYETVQVRQSSRCTVAPPLQRIAMLNSKREITQLEGLSEVKRREYWNERPLK